MNFSDSEKFDPAKLALEDHVRALLPPELWGYHDGVLCVTGEGLACLCIGILEGKLSGDKLSAQKLLDQTGLGNPFHRAADEERIGEFIKDGLSREAATRLVVDHEEIESLYAGHRARTMELLRGGVSMALVMRLAAEDAERFKRDDYAATAYGSKVSGIARMHLMITAGVKVEAAERLMSAEPLSQEEREYLLGETD